MPENKMNEYVESSIEGIKSLAGMDAVLGTAINTPSGVTVIPVQKVTMGFASGGVDYSSKRIGSLPGFGGGGGSGVSITPLGYLTITPNADIKLITIKDTNTDVERITSLIEHSPEIIQKIKDIIF